MGILYHRSAWCTCEYFTEHKAPLTWVDYFYKCEDHKNFDGQDFCDEMQIINDSLMPTTFIPLAVKQAAHAQKKNVGAYCLEIGDTANYAIYQEHQRLNAIVKQMKRDARAAGGGVFNDDPIATEETDPKFKEYVNALRRNHKMAIL